MPRGRAIMIQGTGSHVGKSVLVAALCRILRQDGRRVAPFKAQNMSNNAAVCADGGEIGRAQAEQAAACGIEPTVQMNPVLLKPSSDLRAQVIVLGRPVGMREAGEYGAFALGLLPTVRAALDSLMEAYEVVVIEGAGSPAEVNLRDRDIVNMRIAEMAAAPVLLAGDIDRGGAFAQFVGTLELLDSAERERVAGFIVNKFRGDARLLDSGLRFLESRTGKPVIGVVPFIDDLRVAEEDTPRPALLTRPHPEGRPRIDIIAHPHLANFTDFDALGPSARYVTEPPAEFPDVVILPGTKSTIADLRRLRAWGFADWLRRARAAGVEIVGICGGFQMLGRWIRDPDGVESEEREIEGLGMLDAETTFRAEKRTARVRAVRVPGGAEVDAYEIHAGETRLGPGAAPAFTIRRRNGAGVTEADGAVSSDGRVWGTYLHGLFDDEGFRSSWLGRCRGNGESRAGSVPDHFDSPAQVVREALDMRAVYHFLGL